VTEIASISNLFLYNLENKNIIAQNCDTAKELRLRFGAKEK